VVAVDAPSSDELQARLTSKTTVSAAIGVTPRCTRVIWPERPARESGVDGK
jgi:hypothetical protein